MGRLVILSNWGCGDVFRHLYDKEIGYIPHDLKKDDTLILEGGADIHPAIYEQKVSKFTSPGTRFRDAQEIDAFRKFQAVGASVIGICRGAQLATALLGAPLIQHVDGHGSSHMITCSDGKSLEATSVHHQMLFPFGLDKTEYKMLAWSSPPQSSRYIDGENNDLKDVLPSEFVEPEVVWYPGIRTLAIQGHPEYCDKHEPFREYCVNLVKEYLLHENATA